MGDQAQNLRKLVARKREEILSSPQKPLQKTKVLTVTSGKGGVGKSNLACNLAICLQSMGRDTLLIDGDLGLANVDILLGIDPAHTLEDLVRGTCGLEEIVCPAPGGVRVLAGGSGLYELANMEEWQLVDFIDGLAGLEETTEYMIIDTGAGLSRHNIGFLLSSDQVLVLTTPEPTSMADAYGIIKVMVQNGVTSEIGLVVNRAESEGQAEETLRSLDTICQSFLDLRPARVGWIPEDPLIGESVCGQSPFVLRHPDSRAAEAVRGMTEMILGEGEADPGEGRGIKAFVYRLIGFWG